MNNITGTIFIHNAIKYDFCISEAIDSLLAFCDKVIVMDCSSTDGTPVLLESKRLENADKLTVVYNVPWEVGHNYDRLAIHANHVRNMIRTKWHFMLQADEVVHEDSIPYILEAIKSNHSAFMVRRYNLWGDPNLYVKFDSPKKPVGDLICRLALREYEAERDAESLTLRNVNHDFKDKIKIIHYSFVRKGSILIDKIIDMQTWFHQTKDINGKIIPSNPDPLVVDQKKKDGIFDSGVFFSREHLTKLPFNHPIYSRKWVDEHRNDMTYKRIGV